MSSPATTLLELREISRSFGALRALDRVSFRVARGEVVALLGENGAGKSTLMNVIYGLVAPDHGTLRVAGVEVRISSPRVARGLGIGMVHQHFALAPELTVAENFVLDEQGRALWHFDRKHAEARVRALGDEVGLPVDPRARVGDLAVGDRQRVEILKALKGNVQLLVLDEPTATLTPREAGDLLRVVGRLSASGRACLFISHKLDEARAIAGRAVVLRAGRVVADRALPDLDNDALAELMLGAPARPSGTGQGPRGSGELRLECRALRVASLRGGEALGGVDLELRAGEIVGIAGVAGNGQSELVRALGGLLPIAGGELRIDGERIARLDPVRAASLGVALVPGDRRAEGLIGGLDIRANLVLKHLSRPEFGGWKIDRSRVMAFARERIEHFALSPADPGADVANLSGGNQQRVVLARELAFGPRIVVAENPTRGLDVAASRFVLGELARARSQGAAILLVSTELEDLLELADRLLVLHRGRLTPTDRRDPASLGKLMAGVCA